MRQRRWRREMPTCPDNYSPEIAETAYHLDGKTHLFNTTLEEIQSKKNCLQDLSIEIGADLERINAYQQAMEEEDIDTLTLAS